MHASIPFPSAPRRRIRRAASLIALLALLAACDRSPPQTQLAGPLEAAYQQFTDPSMTALESSCDTAPILAQSLDNWARAVGDAGLQARLAQQVADAKRRAAAIHGRCPTLAAAAAPDRHGRSSRKRPPDVRPTITNDMLDAYVRGINEEIALMRAAGTHHVSLSGHDDKGMQVAAKAGLSLPEYRALRKTMHKVLHEKMMHERYAGAAGQARMAGIEPHQRKYAEEILTRDPYASLSNAERDLVQARIASLRSNYDRYLDLAAVGG